MATLASIQIIHGPSREDVRDSVGSKKDQRINVTFVLNGNCRDVALVHPLPFGRNIRLICVINGINWIDGTGELFDLNGFAFKVEGQDELISRKFTADYRTDKRGGTITFEV